MVRHVPSDHAVLGCNRLSGLDDMGFCNPCHASAMPRDLDNNKHSVIDSFCRGVQRVGYAAIAIPAWRIVIRPCAAIAASSADFSATRYTADLSWHDPQATHRTLQWRIGVVFFGHSYQSS